MESIRILFVDVNIYRYESDEPVPLVINLHGGAFVAGEADTLDIQSDRISKAWGCAVVTVNYKLAKDGITIPPAFFILAGDEPAGKDSLEFKSALDVNGVSTELITYEGALHGFIEENNPEYDDLHFHDSKSPEQEKMARQAEAEIGKWMWSFFVIEPCKSGSIFMPGGKMGLNMRLCHRKEGVKAYFLLF